MEIAHKPSYAKWRVATLVGVHLLFVAHFVHWKLKGRTLAPLEFNEVLYTVHQGIVTAGFILMALTMIATLVFGRFFCSWGCHILALQDAAGWIMDKLKIKRQPVRSRTLIWVPLGVVFYLFIWPQIAQAWHGIGHEGLRAVEAGGSRWSSFVTSDPWRNLPPPGVAVLTFFVCGFVIVYLLGSRGFCFQACPYGALFGVAEQLAPGRIVLTKDCSQCGLCTKACTSDILVHRELRQHGMVTNPRCLKDLDCVAACPEDAVQYGFRMPPLFRKGHPVGAYAGRFSFTLREDLAMLSLFLVSVPVYRGLYDRVPFLLAIALALCTAFGLVTGYHLLTTRNVHHRGLVLRLDGRFRAAGVAYGIAAALLVLFVAHSAIVQYHTLAGRRSFQRIATVGMAGGSVGVRELDAAVKHYERALSIGLIAPADRRMELASLHLQRGDTLRAEPLLTAIALEHPDHIEVRYRLGAISLRRGDREGAIAHWWSALKDGAMRSGSGDEELLRRSAIELGSLQEAGGAAADALATYDQALTRLPGDPELLMRAGATAAVRGEDERAIAYFAEAERQGFDRPTLHNNLGALYLRNGRTELALPHFERLAAQLPDDARVQRTLGTLHARMGHRAQAQEHLGRAVQLDPSDERSAQALAILRNASASTTDTTP